MAEKRKRWSYADKHYILQTLQEVEDQTSARLIAAYCSTETDTDYYYFDDAGSVGEFLSSQNIKGDMLMYADGSTYIDIMTSEWLEFANVTIAKDVFDAIGSAHLNEGKQ